MLRISVDFNTMNQDELSRVSINTDTDHQLLGYLKPGLVVKLVEKDDIEVEATIEFDEIDQDGTVFQIGQLVAFCRLKYKCRIMWESC